MTEGLRTWVEIDARALRHNAEQFLRIIPGKTRLMAIIKSNAYGHGLSLVAGQLAALSSFCHAEAKPKHLYRNKDRDPSLTLRMTEEKIWFGVDSIIEALRLRKDGIENPILVLGHTLPARLADAAKRDILVSIGNFEALAAIAALRRRPQFHLKFDTGMCRQGFLAEEIPKLIALLHKSDLKPHGIFTHFASAKDPDDTAFTRRQIKAFSVMTGILESAGYTGCMYHAAATGGALLFPEAHLDMVRIGMGLYGHWPSQEAREANSDLFFGWGM